MRNISLPGRLVFVTKVEFHLWYMATSSTSTPPRATNATSESPLAAYRWPLTLLIVCLLLIAAVFCGLQYFMPRLPPFQQDYINKEFTSTMPVFRAITGGNLEVGIAEGKEIFKRSDPRYTAFGWVYLGETTSEIKVPVTYRYHIALAGNWRLDQAGKVCIVTVPKLEPSLPVAFDTSRMEKHAENGWSRFDRTEQLDRLEKDITPTLEANAKEERHMDAARQKFRVVVADFVRAWLLKEDQWREDRFTSVIVVFEDEQSNVATPNITVLPTPKQ